MPRPTGSGHTLLWSHAESQMHIHSINKCSDPNLACADYLSVIVWPAKLDIYRKPDTFCSAALIASNLCLTASSMDNFMIDVWWNFDKMQIIFKAITGSSGHAFWGERTVLHSMETVVWWWSGSLGKYQSRKRYLLWHAKVPYVT